MSRVDIFGFSRSFIDELEKKKGKSLTEKEKNQLLTQKGGRLLQFFRPEEITSGM